VDKRAVHKLLRKANRLLNFIPERFVDSTSLTSPDSAMKNSLGWMTRIYDWRLCTRAHVKGDMPMTVKPHYQELKLHFRLRAPWYKYLNRIVYWKLRRWVLPEREKAYNMCGLQAGDRCRHNMPIPLWMYRAD
jgi:hypothetical protein